MDHVIDFNVAGFLVLNELSVKYQKSIKIDISLYNWTNTFPKQWDLLKKGTAFCGSSDFDSKL